jgi:uncharacterized protein (TIGR02453 family)
MAFKGWPSSAIDFFDGLEDDNSKTYWQANKATYDNDVKAPMQALLDELAAEFGEGKIFRPNRDIRFSADKSPYKTSIAASLSGGGYVQLSGAGLAAGSGMWMMASDQLERYRKAVDDERSGADLVKLVAAVTKKSYEVSAHDALKTAPKGYPKDHPRIELLRKKGLVTWKEWPAGAWLATRKSKDRVIDLLHAAEPIRGWLHANVGDSTLPDPMHR